MIPGPFTSFCFKKKWLKDNAEGAVSGLFISAAEYAVYVCILIIIISLLR